ncbi:hypothetical protein ACP4OV_023505 [Aristida adscensionis]
MAGLGTGAPVQVYHEKSIILPDVSRVLACLYEKGIKFNTNPTSSYKGLLRLQSSSHVPVPFYDGPTFLEESREICRYIAEKYEYHGYPFLLGKDALERASVEQWLHNEEHAFNPPSRALFCHLAFPLNKEDNGDDIDVHTRKLEEVLDVYEQRLSDSKFLVGNKFTLADLVHLPNSHHITASKFLYLYDSRKNVRRWWDDISTRESWQNVLNYMQEVERQNKQELEKQQHLEEEHRTTSSNTYRIDPQRKTGSVPRTILTPTVTVSSLSLVPQTEKPLPTDTAPVSSSQSTTDKTPAVKSKETVISPTPQETPQIPVQSAPTTHKKSHIPVSNTVTFIVPTSPATGKEPPSVDTSESSTKYASSPEPTETDLPTRHKRSSSKDVSNDLHMFDYHKESSHSEEETPYIEPTPQKYPETFDTSSESNFAAGHTKTSPIRTQEESDQPRPSDLYESDSRVTGVDSLYKESLPYSDPTPQKLEPTDTPASKHHSTNVRRRLRAEEWYAATTGLNNLKEDADHLMPTQQEKPSKDVEQYPSQAASYPVPREQMGMELAQGRQETTRRPYTDQRRDILSPFYQETADAQVVAEKDRSSSDQRDTLLPPSTHEHAATRPSRQAVVKDARSTTLSQAEHPGGQDTKKKPRDPASVPTLTAAQDARDTFRVSKAADSTISSDRSSDAFQPPLPRQDLDDAHYTTAPLQKRDPDTQDTTKQAKDIISAPRHMTDQDAEDSVEQLKIDGTSSSGVQPRHFQRATAPSQKQETTEGLHGATSPIQKRHANVEDTIAQSSDVSFKPKKMVDQDDHDIFKEAKSGDPSLLKEQPSDTRQATVTPKVQEANQDGLSVAPPSQTRHTSASPPSRKRYPIAEDASMQPTGTVSTPRQKAAQDGESKTVDEVEPTEQPLNAWGAPIAPRRQEAEDAPGADTSLRKRPTKDMQVVDTAAVSRQLLPDVSKDPSEETKPNDSATSVKPMHDKKAPLPPSRQAEIEDARDKGKQRRVTIAEPKKMVTRDAQDTHGERKAGTPGEQYSGRLQTIPHSRVAADKDDRDATADATHFPDNLDATNKSRGTFEETKGLGSTLPRAQSLGTQDTQQSHGESRTPTQSDVQDVVQKSKSSAINQKGPSSLSSLERDAKDAHPDKKLVSTEQPREMFKESESTTPKARPTGSQGSIKVEKTSSVYQKKPLVAQDSQDHIPAGEEADDSTPKHDAPYTFDEKSGASAPTRKKIHDELSAEEPYRKHTTDGQKVAPLLLRKEQTSQVQTPSEPSQDTAPHGDLSVKPSTLDKWQSVSAPLHDGATSSDNNGVAMSTIDQKPTPMSQQEILSVEGANQMPKESGEQRVEPPVSIGAGTRSIVDHGTIDDKFAEQLTIDDGVGEPIQRQASSPYIPPASESAKGETPEGHDIGDLDLVNTPDDQISEPRKARDVPTKVHEDSDANLPIRDVVKDTFKGAKVADSTPSSTQHMYSQQPTLTPSRQEEEDARNKVRQRRETIPERPKMVERKTGTSGEQSSVHQEAIRPSEQEAAEDASGATGDTVQDRDILDKKSRDAPVETEDPGSTIPKAQSLDAQDAQRTNGESRMPIADQRKDVSIKPQPSVQDFFQQPKLSDTDQKAPGSLSSEGNNTEATMSDKYFSTERLSEMLREGESTTSKAQPTDSEGSNKADKTSFIYQKRPLDAERSQEQDQINQAGEKADVSTPKHQQTSDSPYSSNEKNTLPPAREDIHDDHSVAESYTNYTVDDEKETPSLLSTEPSSQVQPFSDPLQGAVSDEDLPNKPSTIEQWQRTSAPLHSVTTGSGDAKTALPSPTSGKQPASATVQGEEPTLATEASEPHFARDLLHNVDIPAVASGNTQMTTPSITPDAHGVTPREKGLSMPKSASSGQGSPDPVQPISSRGPRNEEIRDASPSAQLNSAIEPQKEDAVVSAPDQAKDSQTTPGQQEILHAQHPWGKVQKDVPADNLGPDANSIDSDAHVSNGDVPATGSPQTQAPTIQQHQGPTPAQNVPPDSFRKTESPRQLSTEVVAPIISPSTSPSTPSVAPQATTPGEETESPRQLSTEVMAPIISPSTSPSTPSVAPQAKTPGEETESPTQLSTEVVAPIISPSTSPSTPSVAPQATTPDEGSAHVPEPPSSGEPWKEEADGAAAVQLNVPQAIISQQDTGLPPDAREGLVKDQEPTRGVDFSSNLANPVMVSQDRVSDAKRASEPREAPLSEVHSDADQEATFQPSKEQTSDTGPESKPIAGDADDSSGEVPANSPSPQTRAPAFQIQQGPTPAQNVTSDSFTETESPRQPSTEAVGPMMSPSTPSVAPKANTPDEGSAHVPEPPSSGEPRKEEADGAAAVQLNVPQAIMSQQDTGLPPDAREGLVKDQEPTRGVDFSSNLANPVTVSQDRVSDAKRASEPREAPLSEVHSDADQEATFQPSKEQTSDTGPESKPIAGDADDSSGEVPATSPSPQTRAPAFQIQQGHTPAQNVTSDSFTETESPRQPSTEAVGPMMSPSTPSVAPQANTPDEGSAHVPEPPSSGEPRKEEADGDAAVQLNVPQPIISQQDTVLPPDAREGLVKDQEPTRGVDFSSNLANPVTVSQDRVSDAKRASEPHEAPLSEVHSVADPEATFQPSKEQTSDTGPESKPSAGDADDSSGEVPATSPSPQTRAPAFQIQQGPTPAQNVTSDSFTETESPRQPSTEAVGPMMSPSTPSVAPKANTPDEGSAHVPEPPSSGEQRKGEADGAAAVQLNVPQAIMSQQDTGLPPDAREGLVKDQEPTRGVDFSSNLANPVTVSQDRVSDAKRASEPREAPLSEVHSDADQEATFQPSKEQTSDTGPESKPIAGDADDSSGEVPATSPSPQTRAPAFQIQQGPTPAQNVTSESFTETESPRQPSTEAVGPMMSPSTPSVAPQANTPDEGSAHVPEPPSSGEPRKEEADGDAAVQLNVPQPIISQQDTVLPPDAREGLVKDQEPTRGVDFSSNLANPVTVSQDRVSDAKRASEPHEAPLSEVHSVADPEATFQPSKEQTSDTGPESKPSAGDADDSSGEVPATSPSPQTRAPAFQIQQGPTPAQNVTSDSFTETESPRQPSTEAVGPMMSPSTPSVAPKANTPDEGSAHVPEPPSSGEQRKGEADGAAAVQLNVPQAIMSQQDTGLPPDAREGLVKDQEPTRGVDFSSNLANPVTVSQDRVSDAKRASEPREAPLSEVHSDADQEATFQPSKEQTSDTGPESKPIAGDADDSSGEVPATSPSPQTGAPAFQIQQGPTPAQNVTSDSFTETESPRQPSTEAVGPMMSPSTPSVAPQANTPDEGSAHVPEPPSSGEPRKEEADGDAAVQLNVPQPIISQQDTVLPPDAREGLVKDQEPTRGVDFSSNLANPVTVSQDRVSDAKRASEPHEAPLSEVHSVADPEATFQPSKEQTSDTGPESKPSAGDADDSSGEVPATSPSPQTRAPAFQIQQGPTPAQNVTSDSFTETESPRQPSTEAVGPKMSPSTPSVAPKANTPDEGSAHVPEPPSSGEQRKGEADGAAAVQLNVPQAIMSQQDTGLPPDAREGLVKYQEPTRGVDFSSNLANPVTVSQDRVSDAERASESREAPLSEMHSDADQKATFQLSKEQTSDTGPVLKPIAGDADDSSGDVPATSSWPRQPSSDRVMAPRTSSDSRSDGQQVTESGTNTGHYPQGDPVNTLPNGDVSTSQVVRRPESAVSEEINPQNNLKGGSDEKSRIQMNIDPSITQSSQAISNISATFGELDRQPSRFMESMKSSEEPERQQQGDAIFQSLKSNNKQIEETKAHDTGIDEPEERMPTENAKQKNILSQVEASDNSGEQASGVQLLDENTKDASNSAEDASDDIKTSKKSKDSLRSSKESKLPLQPEDKIIGGETEAQSSENEKSKEKDLPENGYQNNTSQSLSEDSDKSPEQSSTGIQNKNRNSGRSDDSKNPTGSGEMGG